MPTSKERLESISSERMGNRLRTKRRVQTTRGTALVNVRVKRTRRCVRWRLARRGARMQNLREFYAHRVQPIAANEVSEGIMPQSLYLHRLDRMGVVA